jgi:hypothetical protein
MGEPEDVDPAKVRSVSRGCGEFGINRLAKDLLSAGVGAPKAEQEL